MALRVGVRENRESHAKTREAEVRRPSPGSLIVMVTCCEKDLQCHHEGLWVGIIYRSLTACLLVTRHVLLNTARDRRVKGSDTRFSEPKRMEETRTLMHKEVSKLICVLSFV